MPRVQGQLLETERRHRQIVEWMLQDQMTCDIITTGMQRWSIGRVQMQRLIRGAQKLLAEIETEDLKQKISYQVQRAKKAIRDMEPEHKKKPGGVLATKAMLEHIAKIQGLYAPDKVEVNVTSKKVGFKDMKDQEK